ncbi:MAG: hypothetical protein A3G18_09280 [Rhodospirillales bacterium RIFCSPLOWO2_12_FULL_58_28]|nr:MAG: hypothetical protein A3H92_02390 [Rhodospirillales bacterium RIFCSPLOWO2_02_FULL_58_16]OHC76697.1 MAG: hypothetical protein A3G18_09280 [Rhodospirillales bacterium RIFCSPLOWO2_12_FULL_58_28]
MPPEVSVIIPAYRAAKTIARALVSVAAQTLKPYEAIVVDDGSDDGTCEAALALEPRMNGVRLKVFRQSNRGAGAARNRAVAEASRPILAFLDADDEWLPEKLARSLAHIEDGHYLLVAHNGLIVENGKESLIDGARRFREGGAPFVSLYRKGYLDTCTVVTRRDAVIAAGGFDPTLKNGQDFEMWLALLKQPGTRFLVFDEPLSRYHVTPGGIMSNTERRLACCLKIAGRYAPDLKKHPGSAIYSLWFRIFAVHYEAVQVYVKQRKFTALLVLLLKLPFLLFSMTVAFVFVPPPQRPRFLEK